MGKLTDKIEAKTKQVVGKVTDDKKLETEGKIQEISANLKDKAEAIRK